MAILTVPDQKTTLKEASEITEYLGAAGIDYARWEPKAPLDAGASDADILDAYRDDIDRLKEQGGYATADVIQLRPDTPGLDAMLAKFSREHWHDEDEIRFVIEGSGVFHIRPRQGPVVSIEVQAGDLLCVPRGTWHWFDLCSEKEIRCIRLFQDPSGWTPHYTESGADENYQPMCLGPRYFPPRD